MVEEGCPLIPGNELPDRLGETRRYCVIGGGKSGVDACLWLMDNGVVPTDIRWIVPRQPWWIVRERLQFTPEFVEASLSLVADHWRVWRRPARSMTSFLASRSGVAVRLDPRVAATAYRGASISLPELAALRGIADVVRLGQPPVDWSNLADAGAGTDPGRAGHASTSIAARMVCHAVQPGRFSRRA